MKSKLSGVQWARRISLGFFLVLVTAFTVLHQRLPGFPSIDGLCPFGGLETLYAYLAGGELIKNIQPGNIVLMVAITVLGLVLARFFCGWICAFGALQGIFGWLGAKLFRRRYHLPPRIDSILRYLKYLVLALVLVFTWQAGSLVIRAFDPWVAYGHITAPWTELWVEFGIGLVILVASLVLSLFSDRVFCKYLCPLGAVNAILARVPLFRIKRQASSCNSCQLCSRRCPMALPVATAQTMDPGECIACLECVSGCPTKQGTLRGFLAGKALKPLVIVLIGLGIYGAAIGVGQLLGMARFGPASLQQQASAGQLDLGDIKGSNTWADIASSFGVDAAALMRAAGIDPALVPADTMLKNSAALAGKPDFTPDSARLALAGLLGLPYEGENHATAETEPKAVEPVAAPVMEPASPAMASPKPEQPSQVLVVPADFELEGTMTLDQVAGALGATAEQVLARLRLPDSLPRDRALRELKAEYGFTMPELKARIHE